MKFGIVLPTWRYNAERAILCDTALKSLAATNYSERPLLKLMVRGDYKPYEAICEKLTEKFVVDPDICDDSNVQGTEQTLAYGSDQLARWGNIEYIIWMGDDALFHSMWLQELEGLISRHPNAKAWSVYHSAFKQVHKTESSILNDVHVRSICGHGLTMRAVEWLAWGKRYKDLRGQGYNGTYTLDLLHVQERPGERWVTKNSYVQHTGRQGVHCDMFIPEYGLDFQYDGK